MKFNRIKRIIHNPSPYLIIVLNSLGFFRNLDVEIYLKKVFKLRVGIKLNLNTPRTFTEKLQWLKIHDHKPQYTTMVDKYEVKKYVADKIGEQYIIPTLGVWESFDEINFNKLPNQFVLKCTHDSGGLVICRNKIQFDKQAARRKISKSLKRNYYYLGREWPYKNVPPRIIAEQYMKDSETSELRDYKFFCFNGEPIYCQVISDRSSVETIDFYDMEWTHQPFTGLALPRKPFSEVSISVPRTFEKMKKSAKVLSKDIPFVRVDFYEINGEMYFGELTFYPASGFGEFSPDEWNYKLGDMITLPKIQKEMR